MELLYKHIGENVRVARRKANVTQAKLAEALNVSPSHFSGLECGNKRFGIAQLVTIARYLNVPLSALTAGLISEGADVEMSGNTISDLPAKQAAQDFCYLVRNCSQEEIDALMRICKIYVNQVTKQSK